MLAKIKKNYFTIVLTALFLYFFFNLFDGDRGLISYLEKKNIMINLKKDKNMLKDKIQDLSHKNSLLTDKLDLDYIEVLIREKFVFGKKNDKIYIIKKDEN
tara:strand:- start:285 stop:587 length:303 start_codon:yes stop_codon:yes gene_type:complete